MTGTVIIPIILQLLVPLAILGWLAAAPHATRLSWGLTLVLAAAWIGAVSIAGLWLALPWYTPMIHAGLLLVAAAAGARRIRARAAWPRGVRQAGGSLLAATAALGAAALLVAAAAGTRPPAGARVVALAPPLRGGTYLVANGGSASLVSTHVMTLEEPRFRRARGQSYGVDLVRVNPAGFRASGLLPREPAKYLIYGDTIVAPCDGVVVSAADGIDDMPVPDMDREHLAGNHVILECRGVWVLLAHMRKGSVASPAGNGVSEGEPLGVVGNSGNSAEPHLHIHAQLPGTGAEPLGGEPLPIEIDGRYLVRGDRISWRAPR